jgi:hypothetical protein
MESWNGGMLGLYGIILKNITIAEKKPIMKKPIMDRKASTEILNSSGFDKMPPPFIF